MNYPEANSTWTLCRKKIPKNEIIYLSQVVLIYIVVCACIINLSISPNNHSLWASILSGALGYLLPSPSINNRKRDNRASIDLIDGKTKDVALLHTPSK